MQEAQVESTQAESWEDDFSVVSLEDSAYLSEEAPSGIKEPAFLTQSKL